MPMMYYSTPKLIVMDRKYSCTMDIYLADGVNLSKCENNNMKNPIVLITALMQYIPIRFEPIML